MNGKVLIVDDDEELCEELAEVLRDEGYAVSITHDGLSGSRLIESNGYHVVLLDMKMPGMAGYEVLQHIKKVAPGTKVIVLTGRPLARKGGMTERIPMTEDNDHVSRILMLADCVMNKPFDVGKVVAKMAEYTRDVFPPEEHGKE